tara:strand:- start:11130 stop:11390 length:261 start_codon:yes stop_codon:yes gene_type:complete
MAKPTKHKTIPTEYIRAKSRTATVVLVMDVKEWGFFYCMISPKGGYAWVNESKQQDISTLRQLEDAFFNKINEHNLLKEDCSVEVI